MLATRRELFPTLWTEMDRLHNEMERLFGRPVMEAMLPAATVTYPPVNVWEDEKNIYVEAELPGLDLEKIELYVTEGNQLTIKGERKATEPEKPTWYRKERGFGPFVRTLVLPVLVNPEKVVAKFEHGVLFVTLPKAETVLPHRITVKKE